MATQPDPAPPSNARPRLPSSSDSEPPPAPAPRVVIQACGHCGAEAACQPVNARMCRLCPLCWQAYQLWAELGAAGRYIGTTACAEVLQAVAAVRNRLRSPTPPWQ